MSPTFSALGDSVTFMEDQLESLGVFPYAESWIDDGEIGPVANVAARLIRLRRTPGSPYILEALQFQSVADAYLSALQRELTFTPSPKSVKSANQLSLFEESELSCSRFSSAA